MGNILLRRESSPQRGRRGDKARRPRTMPGRTQEGTLRDHGRVADGLIGHTPPGRRGVRQLGALRGLARRTAKRPAKRSKRAWRTCAAACSSSAGCGASWARLLSLAEAGFGALSPGFCGPRRSAAAVPSAGRRLRLGTVRGQERPRRAAAIVLADDEPRRVTGVAVASRNLPDVSGNVAFPVSGTTTAATSRGRRGTNQVSPLISRKPGGCAASLADCSSGLRALWRHSFAKGLH